MLIPDRYLMHYGVMGMKWGVRRYQPYPAGKEGRFLGGPKDPEKRAAGMRRVYEKSSNKLDKIYNRYNKRQAKADKALDKAERKNLRPFLFRSQKGVDRALNKAAKKQRKAFRTARSGVKWYNTMQKYLADISAEDVAKGKRLLNAMNAYRSTIKDLTYKRGIKG